MKNHWLTLILTGTLSLTASFTALSSRSALAQSVYSISADHAQGLTGSTSPIIKVWPGYGTNISFLPTNETILRVWIDDPSRVSLDFDQPLCPTAAASNCESGNPAVIHLRRIQGLNFEQLPRASGTLLTVITETADGERTIYQFQIELATGSPDYHTAVISPVSPLHPLLGLVEVQRGLQIAEARGLINREQDLWTRLQAFFRLVRQGSDVPAAAEQAGVSLALVTRLAEWGAQLEAPALDLPTRSPLDIGADHEQTTRCSQATTVANDRADGADSEHCLP